MISIEQLLKEFGCPMRRSEIVKLARSLHRVGIKRRKSTPHWQRQGFIDCNNARDLLTFARYVN